MKEKSTRIRRSRRRGGRRKKRRKRKRRKRRRRESKVAQWMLGAVVAITDVVQLVVDIVTEIEPSTLVI
jgi:hypothetical protein